MTYIDEKIINKISGMIDSGDSIIAYIDGYVEVGNIILQNAFRTLVLSKKYLFSVEQSVFSEDEYLRFDLSDLRYSHSSDFGMLKRGVKLDICIGHQKFRFTPCNGKEGRDFNLLLNERFKSVGDDVRKKPEAQSMVIDIDALERLAALRDNGILTQEEFLIQKNNILNG